MVDVVRQHSSPRAALRLTWLLKAPQPYEDAYWGSREVQMLLKGVDTWGHGMALLALGTFMLVLSSRVAVLARPMLAGLCCFMAASLLQLYLIQSKPAVYFAKRHTLAAANRLSRLVLMLVPILRCKRDAVSHLLPKQLPAQASAGTLLAYVCFMPLTQVYTTLCFPVAAAATLTMQAIAAVVVAGTVSQSHNTLGGIPGMQQLADQVCTNIRSVIELVLHVFVDQGTMPGVPAAGFDAFGLPQRCGSTATFKTLLLFANLVLTYFVPAFVTYTVELHHKRLFWAVRGVSVAVQASPLLPLPHHLLVSHCIVLFCALLLLWFMAEALNPLLI